MCEYCEKSKKIKCIDSKTDGSTVQVVKRYCKDYPQENLLYAEIEDEDDKNLLATQYFVINYCPMCGRKLGDE
jgi:hypothetical protein